MTIGIFFFIENNLELVLDQFVSEFGPLHHCPIAPSCDDFFVQFNLRKIIKLYSNFMDFLGLNKLGMLRSR